MGPLIVLATRIRIDRQYVGENRLCRFSSGASNDIASAKYDSTHDKISWIKLRSRFSHVEAARRNTLRSDLPPSIHAAPHAALYYTLSIPQRIYIRLSHIFKLILFHTLTKHKWTGLLMSFSLSNDYFHQQSYLMRNNLAALVYVELRVLWNFNCFWVLIKMEQKGLLVRLCY